MARLYLQAISLAIVVAWGVASPARAGAASGAEPLMVSAAVSLKPVLERLTRDYERETGTRVTLNFGASTPLQHQIERGARVDVFVAAAAKPVDELRRKGLLAPDAATVLAGNRLVLVAPKGRAAPTGIEGLAAPGIRRVAIGEPRTVPLGEYAREVLEARGLWRGLERKLVFGSSARHVLTYVESGDADAAIVYATDAAGSAALRVVQTIDPSKHTPITYPAVVVARSRRQPEARAYLRHLSGPRGARAFSDAGFTTSGAP